MPLEKECLDRAVRFAEEAFTCRRPFLALVIISSFALIGFDVGLMFIILDHLYGLGNVIPHIDFIAIVISFAVLILLGKAATTYSNWLKYLTTKNQSRLNVEWRTSLESYALIVLAPGLSILTSYITWSLLNYRFALLPWNKLFYATWAFFILGIGRIIYIASKPWQWKLGQMATFLAALVIGVGSIILVSTGEGYAFTMVTYISSLAMLFVISMWGYMRCVHSILGKE